MPRLPVRLSNFRGAFSHANGTHELFPSWDDLVRVAITTGYPNLASATMPLTFHRTWAVLHRASLVLAYLAPNRDNRIVRSDDYSGADRSEKASISYYLGLFAAKLSAEALLGTPWMLHYDGYHRLATGVGPIAKRPDLIGVSATGRWIAVEAKGRTNGWTEELRASAKAQAQTIGQIAHPNGAVNAVEANIASISFFDRDGWCVIMDDPPGKGQPLRLTVQLGEVHKTYYRPLLEFLGSFAEIDASATVRIDGVEFRVAYDAGLDIFVGVAEAVIESEGADIDEILSAVDALVASSEARLGPPMLRVHDEDGREWSLGADGVIVRLGERWQ